MRGWAYHQPGARRRHGPPIQVASPIGADRDPFQERIYQSVPKLAALMDEAEADVLAYMSFPRDHRLKIHSTNPLERLNGEIKPRTEMAARARTKKVNGARHSRV